MSALPVGIHDGVKMQDYLLHRGLSASKIHTLLTQSPRHAVTDTGGEPSDASDMGMAIHDGLLEGIDRIAAIEADDWRTKAAKEQRDAARADGRIPMLARKVAQVEAAITAAKSFIETTELAGIFTRGKPEQTAIWNEGELICKARPDWLTDERDVILHVKTTQGSAEPSSWIRNQLVSNGYDLASEFYARGLAEFAGIGFNDFKSVFLVIEQNEPYGCSLIALSPAMADLASRKVDRAINIWRECKRTGKYPAYSSQIHYAEPLPWHLAEQEEKELTAFSEHQLEGGIPL